MSKIADTMREIANDPAFRSRNLLQRGLEPVFNAPDDFAAFLTQDRSTAKRVVDSSGLCSRSSRCRQLRDDRETTIS